MKIESDRVVIWQGWLMLLFSLFGVWMAAKGIPPMLSLSFGRTPGFLRLLLVLLLAAWVGAILFFILLGLRQCQTVTIDLRGVRRRGLARPLELGWGEIGEYGLVAWERDSQGRRKRQTPWVFYFSREPLELDRKGRPKLRGDVIRVWVDQSRRDVIETQVLPLCARRSMAKPRIDA